MRVLIHYHIYKNAGTSIDRMLWESFGDRFGVFDGPGATDRIEAGTLARFLAEHPELRAVSSHKARPPLPHGKALPILMLRHPVDRARSAWAFARGNPDMPDHAAARAGDFRAYVAWSLATTGHGAVLREHQLAHLSGAAVPDAADLARVEAMLAAWPAFGIVRRFGESCRLFNARYRPFLPAFALVDTVENATRAPSASDEAALCGIRDELGGALYAALCEANRLDIALYGFACRCFAKKLSRVERPAARLGWRLALHAGRLRQRIVEPGLYQGQPATERTEPRSW